MALNPFACLNSSDISLSQDNIDKRILTNLLTSMNRGDLNI